MPDWITKIHQIGEQQKNLSLSVVCFFWYVIFWTTKGVIRKLSVAYMCTLS